MLVGGDFLFELGGPVDDDLELFQVDFGKGDHCEVPAVRKDVEPHHVVALE